MDFKKFTCSENQSYDTVPEKIERAVIFALVVEALFIFKSDANNCLLKFSMLP